MVTFLIVVFVIFSLFLALFILIQPGKGDMGLGGMSQQMLFGGSGGQGFFQKTTWTLVAVFILGALGLAILKSHETKSSMLQGFKVEKQAPLTQLTSKQTGELPTLPTQKTPKATEEPAETQQPQNTPTEQTNQ